MHLNLPASMQSLTPIHTLAVRSLGQVLHRREEEAGNMPNQHLGHQARPMSASSMGLSTHKFTPNMDTTEEETDGRRKEHFPGALQPRKITEMMSTDSLYNEHIPGTHIPGLPQKKQK